MVAKPASPIESTRRFFGTDGVRGLANREPMTPEIILRLGRALGVLCKRVIGRQPAVLIGRDTRRSGDMLEAALAAGLCSVGIDARLTGVLPTPAIALLTRRGDAAAGAVVSASHNPFADNGVKLFGHDGFKLPDDVEREIEHLVYEGDVDGDRPTGAAVGRLVECSDAAHRYRESLTQAFGADPWLRGVKVVLDCAHGAAYEVAPAVLRQLGAEVVTRGNTPDGENINCEVGALHPAQLQAAVTASQAQLGIGLDGDADRLILVDETGAVVDGDEVLAIMGTEMLAHGTLEQSTVVATVMSNLGLEVCLRERGARLVRTAVGDRYVVEEMVRHGYNLGGEQSGHLVFLDHSTTGDGLLAALGVLRRMLQRGRTLAELKGVMEKFPQAMVNVPVKERRDLNDVPTVRALLARVQSELGDRGRILVRFSGTEPLVRVMVEGEDADRVRSYAEDIADAVRTSLGS